MMQITELAVAAALLTVLPRDIVCGAYPMSVSSSEAAPLGHLLLESLSDVEEANPSHLSTRLAPCSSRSCSLCLGAPVCRHLFH